MLSFSSAYARFWKQWLLFLRKTCYGHEYCQPLCCHFSRMPSVQQKARCCAMLILQHLEVADCSRVQGSRVVLM